jgi:hypothetical protein
LVRSFASFRALLGIEGDRGQTANARAKIANGKEILVRSGGKPEGLGEPPTIEDQPDGSKNYSFSNSRTAREYFESIRRKNPAAKIQIQGATVTRSYPGPAQFGYSFPGHDALRSALKSALTLAHHYELPLSVEDCAPAWSYIAGVDLESTNVTIDWQYATDPWRGLGESSLAHRVGVQVASGLFRADIRYFGGFAIGVEFPVSSQAMSSAAYAVDPLREGSDVGYTLDAIDVVPQHDNEKIFAHIGTSAERIAKIVDARAQQAWIKETTHEAMSRLSEGLKEGEPIPPERLHELARFVAEELTAYKMRLQTTRPATEEDLAAMLPRAMTTKK